MEESQHPKCRDPHVAADDSYTAHETHRFVLLRMLVLLPPIKFEMCSFDDNIFKESAYLKFPVLDFIILS